MSAARPPADHETKSELHRHTGGGIVSDEAFVARGRTAVAWAGDAVREEPNVLVGFALGGALVTAIDWPSRLLAIVLLFAYPAGIIFQVAIDQYVGREPQPKKRVKAAAKASVMLLSATGAVIVILFLAFLPLTAFPPLVSFAIGGPIVAYLACRTTLAIPAAGIDYCFPIEALRRAWHGSSPIVADVGTVLLVAVIAIGPAFYGVASVESTLGLALIGMGAGIAGAVVLVALAHLYIETAGDRE